MILRLPVKREYFEAIRDGLKTEEYRRFTPYWKKRIDGKRFDEVVITLGYPSREDTERTLRFPWKGYALRHIKHPHFGPDTVYVYAIRLEQ